VTCTGPGCGRPVKRNGLCKAHDHQRWRGRPLTPLRARALEDCAEVITLRVPGELVEAVRLAAAAEGVSAAHWWREAARAQLQEDNW
jgi:hypothetical protein